MGNKPNVTMADTYEPQAFESPQDEIETLCEQKAHLKKVNASLNKKLDELREQNEDLRKLAKQKQKEGVSVHNAHEELRKILESLAEVKNGLHEIAVKELMHLSLEVKLRGKVQELDFLVDCLCEDVLTPTQGIGMSF